MLKAVRHCVPRSCTNSRGSEILACEIKGGRICHLSENSLLGCVSEEPGSDGNLDEASKKGTCWSELQRAGLTQWRSCQRLTSDTVEQHEENKRQLSSSILEKGYEKDEDGYEEAIKGESLVAQENRKRKRVILGKVKEEKATIHGKQRQPRNHTERKQFKIDGSPRDRWSAERYELAEKSMLEILKAEGAVFQNPISRPALRVAARKRIGDTGLLDHLLKHIDGKVAPGGAERFRRWHNTNGVMEYWLESADLVDIRRKAGIQDPFWIPPPYLNGGASLPEDPVSGELKLLQAEMAKMKSDMQELVSKKQEQDQAKQIEEVQKELVKWKAKTEQHLVGISSSLNGVQEMYRELLTWKAKTEQQLLEISNSLSSMQALKQCTALSPSASERWEDWLENTNLENVQCDDLAPWLESTELINTEGKTAVQDTCLTLPHHSKAGDSPSQDLVCAREVELLKEEMAKMKRDVQELVTKKHDEDQANLTPDSSAITTTSKSDLDNPFLLFQEMFNELVKWKANMEQQLMEITSCVSSMQASKQVGHTFNSSSLERWIE